MENNDSFYVYNNALEHARITGKLNSIDNISDTKEAIRDFATDLGTGIAVGGLAGMLKGKLLDSKRALKKLANSEDTTLGSQSRIVERSNNRTDELNKTMKENGDTFKAFAKNEIPPKKAFSTVLKNTQKEADIGPNWMPDIADILQKDTGKSEKEIKKIIKNYLAKNENNLSPVDLLETKDHVTWAHSKRVASLVKDVAKQAGMSDEAAESLSMAALLHDIGKLVIPSRVVDSTVDFKVFPEEAKTIKKIMDSHSIKGADLLKDVDDTASNIAKSHHPLNGHSTGSKEEGIVTIADIYDAVTSPRGYKSGRSGEYALYDKGGIRFNINRGETNDYYLDLLKAIKQEDLRNGTGKLPEWYDIESDLQELFPALKANAIKKHVGDQYGTAGAINGAIFGGNVGLLANGLNADKGGLGNQDSRNAIPTPSELIKSISPSFMSRKEKLEDIRRWYNNGLIKDPKLRKLILDTDFSDNKSVTDTWIQIGKTFD